MNNSTKSSAFAIASGSVNLNEGVKNSSQSSYCPVHPKPGNIFLSKRIGGTTYHVGVYFDPQSKESFTDKILRLAKNDLNVAPSCATMNVPQTGWLAEGSSL